MAEDYKNKIEALMFASGRLMDIDTLLSLTGASGKQVLINNISRLKQEYEERNSPMMIVEEKDGWKLTVRESYLPLVRKIISETELPKTILETLAVIAWKAPVLQSEIIDIRHNKAYEHISELEELGFVRKEKQGRSFVLKLSEKFYEYFDVEGAKDIRQVFNKVVGTDQMKVDDFEEELLEKISEEEKIEKTEKLKTEEAPSEVPEVLDKEHDKEPEEFSEL
jgi:segregation and condensation protein B